MIGRYLQHVRSTSVQPQYQPTEINAAKFSEVRIVVFKVTGLPLLSYSGKHQKTILHILMHVHVQPVLLDSDKMSTNRPQTFTQCFMP